MKKTLSCNNTCVFDNVVEPNEFDALYRWFENQPFVFKVAQGEWKKAWGTTDGSMLTGRSFEFPSSLDIDLHELDKPLEPWISKLKDALYNSVIDMSEVSAIVLTPFVYPAGTGLRWHNDTNYVGAFTYYAHREWSAEWAGEFLTIEADEYIEKPEGLTWHAFDNYEVDKFIIDHGFGTFIHPKPNRLIINKAGDKGILHKVNKSTMQAKDRLSLQGFLRKK